MNRLSTLSVASLTFLMLCISSGYADSPAWPLRHKVDLSSGFGDYRDGRFHAGVDIRTGGRIGRRLFSPVNGYIWRIKTAYTGYGKGLYLRGDDGYIYVLAHLDKFTDDIDRAVKRQQIAAERYYLDIYFPEDSFRVTKGQPIGFTGQSGAKAPHLHFERRSPDNIPINPLAHGYHLDEKIAPVLTRVEFAMTDQESLFPNGRRRLSLDIKSGSQPGEYELDSILYLNRPFGLLIDGFDRMREGGMKQAIYKLAVYLDGDLLYRTILDTVDYETGYEVGFEYDVLQAAHGDKRVRRLYYRDDNKSAGSNAMNDHGGIIGHDNKLRVGWHDARIVAEDCYGNRSELGFGFLWGPEHNVFVHDSTAEAQNDLTEFYFSPNNDFQALEIDSVTVQHNVGDKWGKPGNATVVPLENDRLRVDVSAKSVRGATLRLEAHSRYGCNIVSAPFNGILSKAGKGVDMEPEPVEDGLIVTVKTNGKRASEAHLVFYYKDHLLGREYPSRFFSMEKYCFFVPPRREYIIVDRIDLIWSNDTTIRASFSDDVNLAAAGFEDHQTIMTDSLFSIELWRKNLPGPQYVLIRKDVMNLKSRMRMNSDLYTILPEAFVTRKDFEVNFRLGSTKGNNSLSGICWLDEEEDKWVWLEDNNFGDNDVTASSVGGGKFAAVFDHDPPQIDRLSMVPGRTVDTPYPEIKFRLIDSLSGIADDRSIDIRIDDQWMIPEYDPHSQWCKTRPFHPLEPGEHNLTISVTDRAGHTTEQNMIFYVKKNNE
jgi:hypothetical protein